VQRGHWSSPPASGRFTTGLLGWNLMRVLFIGDVVGSPGRRMLTETLRALRRELGLDVVVANGENAAAGRGLTLKTAKEMFAAGVDILTSGNHIWDQKEIIEELDGEAPILRPANYPPGSPGRGMLSHQGLTVINLQGRTFMANIDCPFRAADALCEGPRRGPVLVDMHAEATSEKLAMGWYLDGRVSAVFGSHTHVPTADARILPGGTAYITDAGMTGARDSVLGFEVAASQRLFLSGMPTRLPVEEKSRVLKLNSVLVEIDDASGRAISVERVDREHTIAS
jgi:metallophosphoesterase (TIGR00282 family)